MKIRTFLLTLGLVVCAVLFHSQTVFAHGPTVVYRGSKVAVRVGPSYAYAPYVRYQRPPVVVVRPPKRVAPPPIIYYAPAPHYYHVAPYPW